MTEPRPPFVDDLRGRLVDAARRKTQERRRRHRRILNGFAITAGILMIAMTIRLSERPSEAGILDVRRSADGITVDLLALDPNPQDIVRTLRRYQIEAAVELVPTSANGVGKFVSLEHHGSVDVFSKSNFYREFTLPNVEGQSIVLFLGRAALPGESYASQPNAYSKGEPLHCTGTLGKSVADSSEIIHSRATTITWQEISDSLDRRSTESEVKNQYIVAAVSDRLDSLIVYTARTPTYFTAPITDCEP